MHFLCGCVWLCELADVEQGLGRQQSYSTGKTKNPWNHPCFHLPIHTEHWDVPFWKVAGWIFQPLSIGGNSTVLKTHCYEEFLEIPSWQSCLEEKKLIFHHLVISVHRGQETDLIACVLALREAQEKPSESPQRWEEVSGNDEHAPFSII